VALLFVIGCAHRAPPPESVDDDLALLDGPGNQRTCYAGVTRWSTIDTRWNEAQVHLRRTVSPHFREIVEEWIEPDSARSLRLMRVSGPRFTISFDNPDWTGVGELEGEPWTWDRWRWAAEDDLESMWLEYRVIDELLVGMGGTGYQGDGVGQIDESLERIDCDVWGVF
jgi:hypothetical protein